MRNIWRYQSWVSLLRTWVLAAVNWSSCDHVQREGGEKVATTKVMKSEKESKIYEQRTQTMNTHTPLLSNQRVKVGSQYDAGTSIALRTLGVTLELTHVQLEHCLATISQCSTNQNLTFSHDFCDSHDTCTASVILWTSINRLLHQYKIKCCGHYSGEITHNPIDWETCEKRKPIQ